MADIDPRDPDQLEAAGEDDSKLLAPGNFTPAQRARELLNARTGQESGARVEQQMAQYNAQQKPKRSVGQRVAQGLQDAGRVLQPQQQMLDPNGVHPDTFAKFSQWMDMFKKTGGMM